MEEQKKGILYAIPSPLSPAGFGEAASVRVAAVVAELDFYLAENIRTARRYIARFRSGKKTEDLSFAQLNKDTPAADLPRLMAPLLQGRDMGLLSEAGCPGVADPGALAVAWAHAQSVRVVPLTGPSSIVLALMASGLNGQRFVFHGYLPVDAEQRKREIHRLETDAIRLGQTQIFMETPYRNAVLFKAVLNHCRKDTLLCVARDLNGENEWIRTLRIGDWKAAEVHWTKEPALFLLGSA
jgi:16S rRNA (cytidine1402-2'-O)-methyltransferase